MKLRFLTTLLALFVAVAAPAQVPTQVNYQGRVAAGGVNFTGSGKFKFALVDGGFNSHFAPTGAYAFTDPGTGAITFISGSGGYGYTVAPTVTITGANGSGSGATAIAVLQGGGGGGGGGGGAGPFGVDRIELTNPGSGYQSPVTVTVSAPPPSIIVTTYWSNDGTSNNGSEPTAAVTIPVSAGLYSLGLGDTALANMNAIPASAFDYPDVRLRVWFDDGTATGSQLLSPDARLATVPYAFRAESVPADAITSTQLAARSVTAEKLANRAVDVQNIKAGDTTPTAGQVLSFTSTGLQWVNAGSVGFPFSDLNFSDLGAVLGVGNDSGDGLYGQTSAVGKSGVFGRNDVEIALFGAPAGQGVYGYGSHIAVGVLGVSEGNDGISGRTNATNHTGVFGYSERPGSSGVNGTSLVHHGVYAFTGSANRAALWADAPNGAEAIHGHSERGDGVVGYTNWPGKNGVHGWTELVGATGGFFANYGGGTALSTFGRAYIDGNLTVANTVTANAVTSVGDVVAVNSAERAYLGGDGLGFGGIVDVEFGSQNANITRATFYNRASGQLLDTLARDATVRKITITGGADVAEPFAIGDEQELPKGSVVVIDETRPGHLRRSTSAYDTRVAGVVSGANGIEPGLSLSQEGVNEEGQHVSLTGRVYVLADASEGAIRPGDLMTTSTTPGHAMRASDHGRAQGAILGKAMSALADGTGYVLVLVTLQ